MKFSKRCPSTAIFILACLMLPRPVQPEYAIGNILACVAFMWDPHTLGSLVAILLNFQTYDTNIHVVIVTNEGPALKAYLQYLDMRHVRVHQAPALSDLLHLPRIHFDVVKHAATTGRYNTYLYVEGDVLIPWAGILAWAADVEELQKRGFQRGFLRVGVNQSGVLFCPDNAPALGNDDQAWRQPAINLSTYDKIITVSGRDHTDDFIQLRHSYWAGYVLTHGQVQAYMESGLWAVDVRWDPAADAAGGNQFVNVPPGFDSNTVVPYDPTSRELKSYAFALHLSNKYAMIRGTDQIPVVDILKAR